MHVARISQQKISERDKNMENITGSMATSVIIAHSSLLIILTIVIVFVYLYLNFETNRDGKQCKCGKASVIGAQGQQLSVLPPVPGQPSPSPACQVCALFLYLSLKTKVFLIHCTLYFTGNSSASPFFCQVCARTLSLF